MYDYEYLEFSVDGVEAKSIDGWWCDPHYQCPSSGMNSVRILRLTRIAGWINASAHGHVMVNLKDGTEKHQAIPISRVKVKRISPRLRKVTFQ